MLLVILAVILVLALNFIEGSKIDKIQEMLLKGKFNDASTSFKNIESSFFHRKTKKELKAIISLFSNDLDMARNILSGLDGKPTGVDYIKFLEYFAESAQYRKLEIYTAYLRKHEKNDSLLYFTALYQAALLHPKQSDEAIKEVSPVFKEKNAKELAILEKKNKEMAMGRITFIFDSNSKPLAYYDLSLKKTISVTPGISFDEFTPRVQDSLKFFHLTLDKGIQEKVNALFRDMRGSFILFDVSDSSIISAYSKRANSTTDSSNTVFMEQFEPGSIIKILTLFGYLRSPKQPVFPFECVGVMTIDGRLFHDWIKHDHVESYDDALAFSCNIAFGRMGMTLGYDGMFQLFKQFYFNQGSMKDLFLNFNTGIFNEKVATEFDLANLSVGLNEISITTFHAGFIASVISQDGSLYPPYLIKNKKNLLDIPYYNHNQPLLKIYSDNTVSSRLKAAMEHVVNHPEGTGRRAKVDFVRVALKTGTAGDREKGLDAILIGFFPAEKPKYAFAFRLEGVGKAELKGAEFLRDFLTSFRPGGK